MVSTIILLHILYNPIINRLEKLFLLNFFDLYIGLYKKRRLNKFDIVLLLIVIFSCRMFHVKRKNISREIFFYLNCDLAKSIEIFIND